MNTILIVDDEEGFLHILQVVLQRAGFKTMTAKNGFDALQQIALHRPDLILLDDMMPGMSGSEMCAQIKGDPILHDIPVIMHSAGLKIHDQAHIERIGANGVLAKPAQPREVLAMVNRFVATV